MSATASTRRAPAQFLRPGAWLPLPQFHAMARAESKTLTERSDVPSGPEVQRDLRDVAPRFFRTRGGFRLAGRMLEEDAQLGFQSPAVPLLFALLPLLSVLAALGKDLIGPVGMVLPLVALCALVGAISNSTNGWWAAMAALFGVVLPLLGTQTEGLFVLASGTAIPKTLILFSWSLPVVGLLGLAALIVPNPRLRAWAKAAAGVLVLELVVGVLPGDWSQVFWIALACALAPAYTWRTLQQRYLELEYQGATNLLESGNEASGHVEARKKQALRAKPLDITIGKALGAFTKKYDGFAPDAGLNVGWALPDLNTNVLIVGATGSGKTTVLRTIIADYLRSGGGGLLILDGKGVLPGEFAGMADYLMIDPEHCPQLALLEGLTPQDVAMALEQAAGVGGASIKAGGGNSAFFNTAAGTMSFHTANFLRALADAEAIDHKGDLTKRAWVWCWDDLSKVLENVQQESDDTKSKVTAALVKIRALLPRASDRLGTLVDSLGYIEREIPGMPKETRGGIYQTVRGWLDPVMQSDFFKPWALCETGADPSACLRGKKVGVCLPAITYGRAGHLIQTFINQRVMVEVRRRGSDPLWRAKGGTDIMLVRDEAQDLFNPSDAEFLPQCRSLGARCVFATQNVEGFVSKLGDQSTAMSFLDNFRSFVCLRSSPGTYKWVQERLGTTLSLMFQGRVGVVDFQAAWKYLAEGPLADPTHPGRAFFRKRLRIGSGRMSDEVGSHKAMGLNGSYDGSQRHDIVASRGAKWVQQPLMMDADFDALAESGVAVVETMRGGVRRRDMVALTDMPEVPDDLKAKPADIEAKAT